MDLESFEELLNRVKAEAETRAAEIEGYDPFELNPASREELAEAERILDVRLPEQYKAFMERFGGGSMLYLDILPINAVPSDDDSLVTLNTGDFAMPGFIGVAPVGTGDFWGFTVDADRRCSPEVSFWDHETGATETVSTSFLDFVASEGLRG